MLDISYELSAKQMIHMECQTFLSLKNRNYIYYRILSTAVMIGS